MARSCGSAGKTEAERELEVILRECRRLALGSKHSLLALMRAYSASVLEAIRKRVFWCSDLNAGAEIKRCLLEVAEQIGGDEVLAKLSLAKQLVGERVNALVGAGYGVAVIDARLVTAGLVGQGWGPLKPLFEVGISWDMVLDLPYIPGSSVKGVMTSLFERILNCVRGDKNNECYNAYRKVIEGKVSGDVGKAKLWEAFLLLFGGGPQEPLGALTGNVLFLDAYPVDVGTDRRSLLEPAVITPHYHEGGDVVNTEFDAEPKPVLHLCVAPGTVFKFVIAVPPSKELEDAARLLTGVRTGNVLYAISAPLIKALQEGLIGARTARGYNVFRVYRLELYMPSDPSSSLRPAVPHRYLRRRRAGGEGK